MVIFLSSPCKHEDIDIEKRRFEQITHVTNNIIENFGSEHFAIYSPIAYTYGMYKILDNDIDWYNFDLQFLEKSDLLVIITLEGWELSYGVDLELRYAQKHKIPFLFATPDTVIDILDKYINVGKLYQ